MTDKMTAKQAAARVRKSLDMLAEHGRIRIDNHGNGDDSVIEVPRGLDFTVRATSKGVNITIEDRGWVDRVTGGDREKIIGLDKEADEIKAEVDKIRRLLFRDLPGETKWGVVVISAGPSMTRTEKGIRP